MKYGRSSNAKEKNVAGAKTPPEHAGDVWTWTAICADTKLIPAWLIGDRSSDTGIPFMFNGSERIVVSGAPKLDKISTSYAERSNLTLRMSMRR